MIWSKPNIITKYITIWENTNDLKYGFPVKNTKNDTTLWPKKFQTFIGFRYLPYKTQIIWWSIFIVTN